MSVEGLEHSFRLTGLSHRSAPVALRERLAFCPADRPNALRLLLSKGFREALVVSTCNRVEVLAVAAPGQSAPSAAMRAFLSQYHRLPESEFAGALYELHGVEATRHLFEVSASLDSQILGESEIIAQVKEAYRVACEAAVCGPVLHALINRALFLSKLVRSEGGLARSLASVSSAAVALAKKVFELQGRKVLVVGTGEMATGIVRSLRSAGVREFFVASRTEERAAEFAKREGGTPCRIEQLVEYLAKVDIVLVSAAATQYVISPAQIKAASKISPGRNLCLIDISVPRNVDPAVNDVEGAFLYDIDDLEQVAREGRREREQIAAQWRPRLAEQAREVLRALENNAADTARQLIAQVSSLREEVLGQARRSGLDSRACAELERALERLQGRLLHAPLESLKRAAREGDGSEAATWVRRLFQLQDQPLCADPALSGEVLLLSDPTAAVEHPKAG